MEIPYIYLETRSQELGELWVTNFRLYLQSANLARLMLQYGTMGLPDDISDDVDLSIMDLSRNNFTEEINKEEVLLLKTSGWVLTLSQFQVFNAAYKRAIGMNLPISRRVLFQSLVYMEVCEETLNQSCRLICWLH